MSKNHITISSIFADIVAISRYF